MYEEVKLCPVHENWAAHGCVVCKLETAEARRDAAEAKHRAVFKRLAIFLEGSPNLTSRLKTVAKLHGLTVEVRPLKEAPTGADRPENTNVDIYVPLPEYGIALWYFKPPT